LTESRKDRSRPGPFLDSAIASLLNRSKASPVLAVQDIGDSIIHL